MGAFDIWRFLAGVGIFIFAMYLMEESIRQLSGRAFRIFLRRYTGTRFRALLTGTVSTAILQSSSAISLMLLAFVGAGLMSMPNAIAVILGSNLGTSMTAWIVAALGFKVEIESIALPLLGVGGLGIIFFGQSEKYVPISKLIVGFGFLFLGLDHMKGSIEDVALQIDIAEFVDLSGVIFLLLGIGLTALMQSSSATLAVVLTALFADIITFELAALMVIGSNIGTTITILLGALGGGRLKWRVALSHLVFNVVTGLVALIALPGLLGVVDFIISIEGEPVLALALFHTLFNFFGILIFFPFMGLLARMILKWLPDPQNRVTKYIGQTTTEVVEPAVTALRKETDHLLRRCIGFHLASLKIDETLIWPSKGEKLHRKKRNLNERYERLKLLQGQIFKFASDIQSHETTEEESERIQHYTHASRLLLHACKTMKDIQHNLTDFEQSDSAFLRRAYADFRNRFVQLSLLMSREIHATPDLPPTQAYGELMEAVKLKDAAFIQSISSTVVRKDSLSDMDISTAIIVNRSFNTACQYLVNGWYEQQGQTAEV